VILALDGLDQVLVVRGRDEPLRPDARDRLVMARDDLERRDARQRAQLRPCAHLHRVPRAARVRLAAGAILGEVLEQLAALGQREELHPVADAERRDAAREAHAAQSARSGPACAGTGAPRMRPGRAGGAV
jgi:hypothetical protein